MVDGDIRGDSNAPPTMKIFKNNNQPAVMEMATMTATVTITATPSSNITVAHTWQQ